MSTPTPPPASVLSCARCGEPADHDTRLCCSSHGKQLCHACYRRTHFVEVCNCSRDACRAEEARRVAAVGAAPTPPAKPTKFLVNVSIEWSYEVEADSPEDAAGEWEYDQPSYQGECTGYIIESVTHPGDWNGDDLRADVPCRGGCGKQLPASRNDECHDCLIARIVRENAPPRRVAS